MDTLTYGLSQQIGVYYLDHRWMERIKKDIFNHYIDSDCLGTTCIRRVTKDSIELKDGTSIRFVRVNENARGYCFSKIIIQPGIDEDDIYTIIAPALKHQNRQIMILKDNEEIENV